MKLFAIADLHLSGGADKPMDIFGPHWQGHWDKIACAWQRLVGQDDVVLLPGDISWAMTIQDAAQDLQSISALPGRKVLLRGNHDYWWSSLNKVRAAAGEGMDILQNNAFAYPGFVVCGSRGWSLAASANTPQDDKIVAREALRLELSLQAAQRIAAPGDALIAMTHYPPFNEKHEPSVFTQLFERYGVTAVVYGHLHRPFGNAAFTGALGGIEYHLVSCDYLDFTPKHIVW